MPAYANNWVAPPPGESRYWITGGIPATTLLAIGGSTSRAARGGQEATTPRSADNTENWMPPDRSDNVDKAARSCSRLSDDSMSVWRSKIADTIRAAADANVTASVSR
jgi:hypothetical protein